MAARVLMQYFFISQFLYLTVIEKLVEAKYVIFLI